MMDKRTILVVVACMLALFLLQAVVNRIYPPIPKRLPPVETNLVAELPAQPVEPVEMDPFEAVEPEWPAESPAELPPEEIVTLENDFVRVRFTSHGGGIRSVELLKHRANGRGNALLNDHGGPPALSVVGATNEAFEIRMPYRNTLELRSASGVTKTFTLGESYVITGQIRLPATSQPNVAIHVGTAAPTDPREIPNYTVVDWQGASKFRNRTQPRVADRVKEGKNREQLDAGWIAVKSQYFALVLTPTATNVTGVTYTSPQIAAGPPPVYGVTAAAEIPVTPHYDGSSECAFTFYAGPKEYRQLAALGKHQVELMDLGTPMDFYSGIFGIILVRALGFFYRLIPNYGVAIILVTIVMKILFWPIQAKSIKSMKEMQKFQPLMQKVREKYKDDPQRMNQELWKLQREHGINPAAGCLPMLVQLPVLIAFYRVLISDIALRGAAFLWIKDLAQPDTIATIAGFPLNPLPLLMVATMILQQKMTPTTGDPAQAKMMMFMPLLMLLFFYKVSAGLTLYWTFQQVLSILQQWHSMREDKKPAPATDVGAGKSK